MELKLTVWAQPLCRGVKEPGGAEEERSVLVVEEGVEGVEEGHADGLGGGGANAAVVLEEVVEYEAQLGICQNVSKGLQGGPSGRGLAYVGITFKVLSQAR